MAAVPNNPAILAIEAPAIQPKTVADPVMVAVPSNPAILAIEGSPRYSPQDGGGSGDAGTVQSGDRGYPRDTALKTVADPVMAVPGNKILAIEGPPAMQPKSAADPVIAVAQPAETKTADSLEAVKVLLEILCGLITGISTGGTMYTCFISRKKCWLKKHPTPPTNDIEMATL